jgi:small-conductance mechanosensitive channel
MLIGGLMGFSMIGIEWAKLQWLVAAFGVGLGFGLQEIFANFISGLIILFEKPIRIGDTVTIRDLTGSVTASIPAQPPSATGTVKRLSCLTRPSSPSSLSTGRSLTRSPAWC